jgi:hypothetical protein
MASDEEQEMTEHEDQRQVKLSLAQLEERVRHLEARTEAVAGAIRLLARGLEENPLSEPDERAGVVKDAARRAHELLLVADADQGSR